MLKRREFEKAVVAGGVMAVLPAPVSRRRRVPREQEEHAEMPRRRAIHSVAGAAAPA